LQVSLSWPFQCCFQCDQIQHMHLKQSLMQENRIEWCTVVIKISIVYWLPTICLNPYVILKISLRRQMLFY
jgi:hypothetical protein